MFQLFTSADKLVVSIFNLRQHFTPPSVQVFQVSFEFLCRLFSGGFAEQVLSGVVDVLQASGTVL